MLPIYIGRLRYMRGDSGYLAKQASGDHSPLLSLYVVWSLRKGREKEISEEREKIIKV